MRILRQKSGADGLIARPFFFLKLVNAGMNAHIAKPLDLTALEKI